MVVSDTAVLKVLVVDDEPMVCESFKLLLASDGYSVETVESGERALSRLGEEDFDVVITDYAMPEMKGDQLAARIKSRWPNLPVIMITVYAEMLQSSPQPPPHADAFVTKPFSLDDLRHALSVARPPA
jgi:CheY-like chemotaxis protein